MFIHYHFESGVPGPNILIIWSIHWDEICWSNAIERLRHTITMWELKITYWSVTCVPYTNYRAYRAQKRQDTVNLNRAFGENEFWETMTLEEKVAVMKLKELIQISDFVLDLHSFPSWEDIPFIFKDIYDITLDVMISRMPIEYVVSWWNELYKGCSELDTIWYTSKLTKLWFCIECWLTGSDNANRVAFHVIDATLKFFWILSDWWIKNYERTNQVKEIRVNTIIRKPKWGYFIKPWKNFSTVNQDTVIWVDVYGNEIRSNQTWYIIIPNDSVEEWAEWCYLWIEL